MKWPSKISVIGLLCLFPGCGDAKREVADSPASSSVEPAKPVLTSSATSVKPDLSESELALQRDRIKQKQETAKVAFEKIDEMSRSAPEFAQSLLSFWNEHQATASPATRRAAIYAFNQLLERHPLYQTPEELGKLGLDLNSELVLRGKINRTKLWAEKNVTALTDYAERVSKTEAPLGVMVELWDVFNVDKDLEFAEEWLPTLPKDFAQAGWRTLMSEFVENDSERLDTGLQIIDKMQPSIDKDLLLSYLLPNVLAIDPDAAAAWAKQLHQPGLEREFLKEVEQARSKSK